MKENDYFLSFRDDCITLLRDCSNSTFSPEAVCDIIAPTSSNNLCVHISDYICKGMALVQHPPSIHTLCQRNPSTHCSYICSLNFWGFHSDEPLWARDHFWLATFVFYCQCKLKNENGGGLHGTMQIASCKEGAAWVLPGNKATFSLFCICT